MTDSLALGEADPSEAEWEEALRKARFWFDYRIAPSEYDNLTTTEISAFNTVAIERS